MKESTPNLQPRNDTARVAGIVASEIPEAPIKLSAAELDVWNYVANALNRYDLIHLTDGLTLSIICKTFIKWVDTEKQLEAHAKKNKGSYLVVTPNGYEQPHQLFHMASRYKKELLQWLPEAALTIPSFSKIIQESTMPVQAKLFTDPVETHRQQKTKIGLVGIDGGKASTK